MVILVELRCLRSFCAWFRMTSTPRANVSLLYVGFSFFHRSSFWEAEIAPKSVLCYFPVVLVQLATIIFNLDKIQTKFVDVRSLSFVFVANYESLFKFVYFLRILCYLSACSRVMRKSMGIHSPSTRSQIIRDTIQRRDHSILLDSAAQCPSSSSHIDVCFIHFVLNPASMCYSLSDPLPTKIKPAWGVECK